MSVDYRPILELYEAGQYLTAFRQLEPLGGLDALVGPAGRALAGRLATNLGADRYGSAIHLRAWRQEPDVESLGFYVGLQLARLRGIVSALTFLNAQPTDGLTPTGKSDLLSARAQLLTSVRDFSRAEKALDEAFSHTPNRAWLMLVRGQLLTSQDRTLDGLAEYQRALQVHPYFRPAVQSTAEALTQLNRLDEARELLIDASTHLESGAVLLQLAQLERELGMHESARSRLRAAEKLMPLRQLDRDGKSGFDSFDAILAYDCGQIEEAIELASRVDTPYFRGMATQLKEHGVTGKRVVLDVGFTLQHADTCAPATMATLTEYWKKPLGHLEIVEAICYDGTPAQAERGWLEENGFYCREFTITWDSARALIDAGIPFTQTLHWYRMGHLQAVIGYDSRRGLLLIRDPNVRHLLEYRAEELLEAMRSSGPRGLAFVPPELRGKLDAITLSDTKLWDEQYELAKALEKHDRASAFAACERMAAVSPEHRLTTFGRARLASYDGDRETLKSCTDKLLAEFPNDQNQWSVKLSLLRENGTREQRLGVLSQLSDKKDCETVFVQQYVDELLEDPATRSEAAYRLRRRLHRGDIDGQLLTLQARLQWMENRREEALEWFRFAACVDGKDESRATTYFAAARALNRTDEALAMLRDRFDRFCDRSGGPGKSLAEALDQLCQTHKAVVVLDEALSARPKDAELKLYAADFLARIGREADARQHLADAEPMCRAAEWQNAAARLAFKQNRLEDAWGYIQASLHQDPISYSTHNLAIQVLSDLRGVQAAVDYLRGYVQRFPENQYLRTLLIDTMNPLGPEAIEPEVREFLKLHPQDAWGWRELGLRLAEQRRWQEAHDAAKRGLELDPQAEQVHLILGMIYRGVGKLEKARGFLLRAVQSSADYSPAISELMTTCDRQAERREALTRVFAELKRQVIRGYSLLLVRDYAAAAMEPAETLRMLLEARQSRPDLWQAWSALVKQLLSMDRRDDALKTATSAASRFPLLPPSMLDLADVYRLMEDGAKERAAINRALAVNSRDGGTLRRSAEAYQRAGDSAHERKDLERACESEPRDVTHRGALAEFLWREGQREEALAAIGEAIEREPLYDWGWRQLATWSRVVGEPKRPVALANKITETHAKSPLRWLQRARILSQFPEHHADCIKSIEQAIALDPRSVEAHDLHASQLADRGDYEAAIRACSPPVFAKRPPMRLKARAAVIEHQRGNAFAAIEKMRSVVDEDPRNGSAWAYLSEWYEQQGDVEESLDCAKKLLEAAPDSPASWGYVASGLLNKGQREEARRHLRKALSLDSGYLYAGHILLQIDLEDQRYDDALETLKTMGPHLPEDELHARSVTVACQAGKTKEALDAFRSLCQGKQDEQEQLQRAMNVLLQRGEISAVRETLLQALEREGHNPRLAAAAVELYAREVDFASIAELLEWLESSPQTWSTAMAAYVQALGEAGAAAKLTAVVQLRGSSLRENMLTWSAVGRALEGCGLHEDCRHWMNDWLDRPNVEGRAIAALMSANLVLDQIDEAIALSEAADRLPEETEGDVLRLLAAGTEIARENATGAAERLASVQPARLDRRHLRIYELAKAAAELATAYSGGNWKLLVGPWKTALAKARQSADDDLLECIATYCELMLAELQPNWIGPMLQKPLLRRRIRKNRLELLKRPRAISSSPA